MKSKATLKEIAASLGISISTVSRALSNHPKISKPTRDKVKEEAKKRGYYSTGYLDEKEPIKIIAVVVPEIKYHFYAQAISGIEQIAEQHEMRILICQTKESYEREYHLIHELIDVKVSGIIVSVASETRNFDHFEAIKTARIPLIFFNRQCEQVKADEVYIDNEKAAFDAVQHLVETGCESLAYFGGPSQMQISKAREKGFKKALEEHGIESYLIEHTSFQKEQALTAARKLLFKPKFPDGILTYSDQLAINILIAAKERGLQIPEKISLIGFNNEPINEVLTPTLTSIHQPAFEMGQRAAELIVERISSRFDQYQQIIFDAELIVRESTNRNR